MRRRAYAAILGAAIVLSASAGVAAKVKLEAWIQWSSGQSYDDFKTACTMYEKSHPNVVINLKAVTPLGEKIKVSTTAGISPDITFIDGGVLDNAARYSYFVKPLDSYLKREGLDGAYLKPALEVFSWDGTVYGVPWSVDPNFAMVFNADAFAEVGLPAKAPETPDDVLLFNAKLMQTDANGKVNRMGMVPWRMYGEHTALLNWGFAWGSGQLSDVKHYTLTNPNILKAIDYWMAFGDRFGGMKQVDAFGGKPYSNLKAVAMQPMVLPDLQAAIKQNKAMRIGIGEMPATKEGVTPTWLGGQWLGIGIHSKHAAEAWDFIKFATTDMSVAKATRLGRFSGSKTAYSQKIYESSAVAAVDDKMAPLLSFYATIVPKAQRITQAPLWDTPGMCAVIRRIIIDRRVEKVAGLTEFDNQMNKRIDAMLKKTVVIPSGKRK